MLAIARLTIDKTIHLDAIIEHIGVAIAHASNSTRKSAQNLTDRAAQLYWTTACEHLIQHMPDNDQLLLRPAQVISIALRESPHTPAYNAQQQSN